MSDNLIEDELLPEIAKKYTISLDRLKEIWQKHKNLDAIANKYNINVEELNSILNRIKMMYHNDDDDLQFEYDVDETPLQFGYNEQQHTFNENEISLMKFGLVDVHMENMYNMGKLRLLEGETKFFLRQLINCYRFLKFNEKLALTPLHFNAVYDNLPLMTFSTKKSPLGLLLAIYVYDKNNIVDMTKFRQICKVKRTAVIDAHLVIPIVYIYKVYASDVVRYAKLFHTLLK